MSRDLEKLSAYLDNALDGRARARLEARLKRDAVLRADLDALRQTRALLRRAPRRAVPRSFVLTRQMAGVQPPVPRLAFWAQGVAALAAFLLFFNVFLGHGMMGAALPGKTVEMAAPQAAEAPVMEAPSADNAAAAPTDAPAAPMMAAEPESEAAGGKSAPVTEAAPRDVVTPPPVQPARQPVPWRSLILLAVAVLALGFSLWLRWRVRRRFRHG